MRTLLATLASAPSWQRACYWSAITIYVLIVVLGSIPGNREDIGELAPGAVLHSIAYAGLSLLLFLGSNGSRYRRAAKSILTIAVMGAFDEYVQSFFPYRTASVADWGIDLIAGTLACTAISLLWPRFMPAEPDPARLNSQPCDGERSD